MRILAMRRIRDASPFHAMLAIGMSLVSWVVVYERAVFAAWLADPSESAPALDQGLLLAAGSALGIVGVTLVLWSRGSCIACSPALCRAQVWGSLLAGGAFGALWVADPFHVIALSSYLAGIAGEFLGRAFGNTLAPLAGPVLESLRPIVSWGSFWGVPLACGWALGRAPRIRAREADDTP